MLNRVILRVWMVIAAVVILWLLGWQCLVAAVLFAMLTCFWMPAELNRTSIRIDRQDEKRVR